MAFNLMKKREKKAIVELHFDFQKAYDNLNHDFLDSWMSMASHIASKCSSSR